MQKYLTLKYEPGSGVGGVARVSVGASCMLRPRRAPPAGPTFLLEQT